MNAQQQDILRLLTARGPMTSRELFDVMQDELGYWSQASTHDQIQRAVESLSKILSKMKAENLINGEMTAQPKGRPVMVWSAPISDGYIAGVDDVPEDDTEETTPSPHPLIGNLTSMESDITDVLQLPKPLPMEFIGTQMTVKSGYVNDPGFMYMNANAVESGVVIHGRVVIRNRAELAQFIGAIERMMP